MKWYVGVDGGGTKTAFAASGADGLPAAELRRTGCSYQMIGIDAAVELIARGVYDCLATVGAQADDCAGCCVGLPCYGENTQNDQIILKALQTALKDIPLYVANDVEVAYVGSLEGHAGIHLVAGTGSIAFGRGSDKKTARCGGWIEFFGDEGSCYWVGREAMSLFSKETDGRVPRGALYELVRRELGLEEDCGFTDVVLRELAPNRERVAMFQLYARQAAEAGDIAAAALYDGAAQELALMVAALARRLVLPRGETKVSYSGGLFGVGELILQPLRERVEALGCTLCPPRRSPVEGALILAIEQFQV